MGIMAYDIKEIECTIDRISKEVNQEMKCQIDLLINRLKDISCHGLPTPVLSVCGHGSHEVRYTKYLTYYLNHRYLHGFNDRVLKAAFNQEALKAGLAENWSEECEVFAEYPLGIVQGVQSYLDILIKGHDFAICIEQKIFSGESNNNETEFSQLNRYAKAIEQNESLKDVEVVKIYLTPTKKASGSSPDWVSLSHKELTERLIPLLNEKDYSQTAIENLRRLLMDLSMGPYKNKANLFLDLLSRACEIREHDYFIPRATALLKSVEEYNRLFDIVRGGRENE
ncbi:PD-(D/E)XK nuclease family protein [Salisediminibacterium beveridgei]|uniref:PD-(D/E)XK nuclease superfamily protein n=1 Tax=Salisediminibacterium beveridgei TaxID=632773 RepID=A0A1D7QWX6_9BACI|nr:PD-(D/E)XK nuclease family protein [Salisediminibacterium beveridgei]AOM83517.1 hypothetical protein BBEV_2159 [Salisediminibacterium beveridgei]